ncbi:MAG: dehypoxanthine futalosine cyclase, partial [Planctomycetes bacterium]|nr:dehypoxanthine futalosine cyclase [Planctomycetota bacterium]
MRSIDSILRAAADGERMTPENALRLFEECQDLSALGKAADSVTRRLHPESYRTYNIDRNINYTNVCAAVCHFCAFYRKPGDSDAYVLTREELCHKIDETIALGGDQALLQGGMHPTLKLEWYEDLLRFLKERYPDFNLHAFSPPEIWHFHKLNKIPLQDVLSRLKNAGMGSLPGGGGEILVDRVRKELTINKCLSDAWLEVNRVWHGLGGHSTCTMMFGHVETLADRVESLNRLRLLQDETGGFTAFICWTFQPEHTHLAHLPPVGSHEYLRTQAISRLFLDNIPNIQSSWVTQGLKIGQLALQFGANDMGSLMIEENVVS